MIELNKKAKPFNPAEEIVGSELYWALTACRFILGAYYDPKHGTQDGEILALTRVSQYSKIKKQVLATDWKLLQETKYLETYVKGKYFFSLTTDRDYYHEMVLSSEIIKYMGIFEAELVSGVHKIVGGLGIAKHTLNKNGEIETITIAAAPKGFYKPLGNDFEPPVGMEGLGVQDAVLNAADIPEGG